MSTSKKGGKPKVRKPMSLEEDIHEWAHVVTDLEDNPNISETIRQAFLHKYPNINEVVAEYNKRRDSDREQLRKELGKGKGK